MRTTVGTPFAALDRVSRGESAPAWLASGIVDAWNLPVSATVTLIALSENATFRVDVDGRDSFVVRVHRPGHVQDVGQIVGELAWMTALEAHKVVSVPRVLPCRSGEIIVSVLDSSGTRWHCVAFTFVSGQILEDLGDPRPYYRQIGAAAARMHEHAVEWSLPPGNSRFEWTLSDMLGPKSRWGDWRAAPVSRNDAAVLEAAESAAREELATLPTSGANWGLIHADLRPSNIMIDGDTLTVIDFDDCGYSWLLYDFAAALSFIEHEEYAPEIAQLWVAGYRSVRPLSSSDLVHANALSMVRRLTMLGWTTTHREDALPAEIWAAQIPGTVAVARRYLASRTWLFDDASHRPR